jgi:hypothetical protein
MTPSITQSQIFTALGTVLTTITGLPSGSILQGQQSLVPPPAPADYIIMTPLRRVTLATNEDGGWVGQSAPTSISVSTAIEFVAQIDVFGPNAGDNAHVIQSLFRAAYVYNLFAGSGYNVAPLYPEDPRQAPLIDGEANYEQRWIIDLHLMVTPILTPAMQFADQAKVSILYEADQGSA